MVVVPFGFSVGDFIAAVGLVSKAAKALREVHGATQQFQQASVDLLALDEILTRVERLDPAGPDIDLVQSIHLCAHTCHLPLRRFIGELKRLEPFLQLSAQPWRRPFCRRSIKKIDWAIRLEKEVAKLKASISPQLASISLLLQLEALNRTSHAQGTLGESLSVARQLLAKFDHVQVWMSGTLATKRQLCASSSRTQDLAQRLSREISSVSATGESTHNSVESIERRLSVIETILKHGNGGLQQLPAIFAGTSAAPGDSQSFERITIRAKAQDINGKYILSLCQHLLQTIRVQSAAIVFAFCALVLAHAMRTWTLLIRGPTLILDTNIHLEDALGRSFSFQFEHFRHWRLVQARLELAFVGLPGEEQIKTGRFHLERLSKSGGQILSWEYWEATASPGCRMIMSIRVQQPLLHIAICPVCYSPTRRASRRCYIQCNACGLTYEVMVSARTPRDFESMVEEANANRCLPDTDRGREAYIVYDPRRSRRKRATGHHHDKRAKTRRHHEPPTYLDPRDFKPQTRARPAPSLPKSKRSRTSDIGALKRVHSLEPSLSDILSNVEGTATKIDLHRRERWAMQILGDLRDIHEAGFVHQDVTTAKIMIGVNDEARMVQVGYNPRPTRGWEPPEVKRVLESGQYASVLPTGQKSDLYQLGLVLCFLLLEHLDGDPTVKAHHSSYFERIARLCLSERP